MPAQQMESGKAFEYALLKEFNEKLSKITNVQIIKNNTYDIAKKCFDCFDENTKGTYLLSASFAVNFLIDIEPRLSHGVNEKEHLQLEILPDRAGESGDVRDILAIRLLQKWEIGVSAKNNHHAVKHSRLSSNIDFGYKWLGVNCSSNYFNTIKPIFSMLETIKKQNPNQKWSSLDNYHLSVYKPILDAFITELLRISNNNKEATASKLVEYLVGNKDYYKVIKNNNSVEIQAFNLHGTLNLSFNSIQPKFKTPIICLPTEIISVDYKENSLSTVIVKFNQNWELSFRIHNASSRVEPSLKFDINLISVPHSLFTNTLSVIV